MHEFLDEHGALGARADDAHITFEDIEELGKFVETGAAKDAANGSATGIAFYGPARIAFGAMRDGHGSEFVHRKKFAVKAQAVLNEDEWTGRTETHSDSDKHKERKGEQ